MGGGGLFTIYIKNPSGFKLCNGRKNFNWNISFGSRASISVRPVKYGEDPGSSMKFQKVQLERNKPVETSELFKEDTFSAITGIHPGGQPYANTS